MLNSPIPATALRTTKAANCVEEYDVLIAGAGCAGCATAISLSAFAPQLKVCLIGPSPVAGVWRIGETLPPLAEPVLQHLGLWSQFVSAGHYASYRTLSAWADSHLRSNEFLLHPYQRGWRIDRSKFDRMLLAVTKERVTLHVTARVTGISRDSRRWKVSSSDGSQYHSKMLVDATGRAAVLARLLGCQFVSVDKLMCSFVHLAAANDRNEDLVIEAVSDGWWYSAKIPNDRRIVAFMTDVDVMRKKRMADPQHWFAALAETKYIFEGARSSAPLGRPRLCSAATRSLAVDTGGSLVSVGDAASSFDPLAGQGILKALRSGIFASYAISDRLQLGKEVSLRRHRMVEQKQFAVYLRSLRDYYAVEQRWRDVPFWRRRHLLLTD
jgi:2-polyprenyl-6-methoxyphenol hydroxylase-like FAD-dependent oxidoreductase